MSEPTFDIIKSPEAERMLQFVTKDFYNRSHTGLWMFEVIGREYDEMAIWSDELKYEIFPQTCTWSITAWEWVYGINSDDSLPLDLRRARIMVKRLEKPPLNPARIEAVISLLTGCPVTIIYPQQPYAFKVIIDESNTTVFNYPSVLKTLRTIKPSHLSFDYEIIVKREYTQNYYNGGAITEYIQEEYTG